MSEKEIRNTSQSLKSVRVFECDRLVARVPARHNQRPAELGEQQMMERRIREHYAKARVVGCQGLHHQARFGAGTGSLFQQDDGPLPREKERLFLCGHLTHRTSGRGVGRHHRKGFRLARFSRPQLLDGGETRRITGQMVPTESLDCDNRSLT